MSVQQWDVIDFVVHDPASDSIVLVLVEDREWGHEGELLVDLQAKLNTYLLYVGEGRLWEDFPEMWGRPVRFELRCPSPPGERETEFMRIVAKVHLEPVGIHLMWRQIGGKG